MIASQWRTSGGQTALQTTLQLWFCKLSAELMAETEPLIQTQTAIEMKLMFCEKDMNNECIWRERIWKTV